MTFVDATKSSLNISICLTALLIFFSSNLHAQFSGAVEGYVEDSTGAVIPGAEVSVIDENLGVERTITSNETGLFRIGELPAGTRRESNSLR